MTTFKTFEDIQAWQEARKLIRTVRQMCKRQNVQRDFSFIDQISRSSRSIYANIAEGHDSGSIPKFIYYLHIAKGSCGETRSHLYDAIDEQYISKDEFITMSNQCKKISKMIAGLVLYLEKERR